MFPSIGLLKQKNLRFVIVICMFYHVSNSQNITTNTSPFWSNVQFGGGIGIGFANEFFSATVAPSAVYRINNYVATGVGLNFRLNELFFSYTNASVKSGDPTTK